MHHKMHIDGFNPRAGVHVHCECGKWSGWLPGPCIGPSYLVHVRRARKIRTLVLRAAALGRGAR